MKSLVIIYPASTDTDLPILGQIKVSDIRENSKGQIIYMHTVKETVVKVDGSGNLGTLTSKGFNNDTAKNVKEHTLLTDGKEYDIKTDNAWYKIEPTLSDNDVFETSAMSKYHIDYFQTYGFNLDIDQFAYAKLLKVFVNEFASGDVSALKACTALTYLDLNNTQVSGDVSALKACTALTNLGLNNTQVSGDVSALKACTALTYLGLSNTQVSGDVSALKACTALTYLGLNNTQVSGDVSALKACTALTNLGLNNTQVSGDVSALKACTALTYLDLNNTQVSGDVANMNDFNFKRLRVNSSNVTGDASSIYNMYGFAAPITKMSWSSKTARSSKTNIPLWIYSNDRDGLDLGDDVDNCLIDEAACTNVSGNTLDDKCIRLIGNRTSASDTAIQTLQNAGITVTIKSK